MLEIKRVNMHFGDGMREVVVVTSPHDQRIFHNARKFELEVTQEGEVTMSTEEED